MDPDFSFLVVGRRGIFSFFPSFPMCSHKFPNGSRMGSPRCSRWHLDFHMVWPKFNCLVYKLKFRGARLFPFCNWVPNRCFYWGHAPCSKNGPINMAPWNIYLSMHPRTNYSESQIINPASQCGYWFAHDLLQHLPLLSQPYFGQVWGVKPNTWKKWGFGVLRDSRMFRARQQGPKHLALACSWCHWKGLEAYISKMASHWPFGHLSPKLWAKEGPGVKLAVWLPTAKSWESTSSRPPNWECDTSLDRWRRGLQVWFRPRCDQTS